MQVARFYIEHSDVAFDYVMPEGTNLSQLMQAVRNDGWVLGKGFWVPLRNIAFVCEYSAAALDVPEGRVVQLVPNPDKLA